MALLYYILYLPYIIVHYYTALIEQNFHPSSSTTTNNFALTDEKW